MYTRERIACENSGHDSSADFAKVSKIVEAGAASKPVKDYEKKQMNRLKEKAKKGTLMLDE